MSSHDNKCYGPKTRAEALKRIKKMVRCLNLLGEMVDAITFEDEDMDTMVCDGYSERKIINDAFDKISESAKKIGRLVALYPIDDKADVESLLRKAALTPDPEPEDEHEDQEYGEPVGKTDQF